MKTIPIICLLLTLSACPFNDFDQLPRRSPRPVQPSQPAILIPVDETLDGPFISDNNLLQPGPTHVLAYTRQRLGRGSWLEATLEVEPTDAAQLGVVQPEQVGHLRHRGVAWPLQTFYSEVEWRNAGDGSRLTVYHGLGGPGFPPIVFTSASLGSRRTVRIRVEVGDRLRYYRDHHGPSSTPFFVSNDAPPIPLVGQLTCTTITGTGCRVRDVRVGRALPVAR
jgi:hypothetical protein